MYGRNEHLFSGRACATLRAAIKRRGQRRASTPAKQPEGVNYARFALVDGRSLNGYNHSNSISAQ